jgi:hypothetical protein
VKNAKTATTALVRCNDSTTTVRNHNKTAAHRAHNPVSHRADHPDERNKSSGNSKRNRSRDRRCPLARPAMPNRNQRARNLAVETSRLVPRARRFPPPTRAQSLVGEEGGK